MVSINFKFITTSLEIKQNYRPTLVSNQCNQTDFNESVELMVNTRVVRILRDFHLRGRRHSGGPFTFHVRLVVEVGHLPAVLLVVVVMRVRGMMRRRYGLGVRCGAVVEVHLRPVLVGGLRHQLLGLLDALRPGAYHPHEQRDDDQEYDGGRDAAGDVRELGLVLAVWPDERPDAAARRLPAQVLDARTLVLAIVVAHVAAHLTGAVEPGPALALEVRRLRYQQAVRVYVAVFARRVRLARVPALGLAGLQQPRRRWPNVHVRSLRGRTGARLHNQVVQFFNRKGNHARKK